MGLQNLRDCQILIDVILKFTIVISELASLYTTDFTQLKTELLKLTDKSEDFDFVL